MASDSRTTGTTLPTLAALIGCLTLAAALRFPDLGNQSLWLDEIDSIDRSTWPLRTALTATDSSPPLFQLLLKLLHVWFPFDLTGRVISAVAGTISVGLLLVLGTRLWGRRVGTLAALLLAISPLHVWYSREGRMYALFALWSLLSTLLLESILRRSTPWTLAGYALATVCGVLTQYVYAGVFVAQLAFVCLAVRWPARRTLLAIGSGGALALVFVLPFLIRDGGVQTGSHRAFTWSAVPYTAFAFLAGLDIGPSVEELHRNTTLGALGPYWMEVTVVAVVGVVVTTAGVRALQGAGLWGRFLVLMLIVPIALGITTSRITGLPFNVRLVLGSLPAFELLVALGIAKHGRVFAAMSLSALVAIAALSIGRDRLDPHYSREDLRGAGGYLESVVSPGDSIVVSATEVRQALAHYFHRNVPLGRFPPPAFASAAGSEAQMRQVADDRHVTWLVLCREWDEDQQGFLRQQLAASGATPTASFPGVRIYRFGS